jgi:hypothetical protein
MASNSDTWRHIITNFLENTDTTCLMISLSSSSVCVWIVYKTPQEIIVTRRQIGRTSRTQRTTNYPEPKNVTQGGQ